MNKIQVLQGLNLQSNISSIIITLQKTDSITKLLDLIKVFTLYL